MSLTNSPAPAAPQRAAARAAELAHAAIRSLLHGSAPAALADPATQSYGRWTATLERLFAAHAAAGTPAVAQAYQELHRADDDLIALIGSGGKLAGELASPPIMALAGLLAAKIPRWST